MVVAGVALAVALYPDESIALLDTRPLVADCTIKVEKPFASIQVEPMFTIEVGDPLMLLIRTGVPFAPPPANEHPFISNDSKAFGTYHASI